jgi:hypothetical protein
MSLGVVRRTESDLAGWLATEAGFISGLRTLERAGAPGASCRSGCG